MSTTSRHGDPEREAKASRSARSRRHASSSSSSSAWSTPCCILALASAVAAQWWLAVVFFVFALVAVNVVYLTGRSLPLKYLLPGMLFLIVFQLYTMRSPAFSSFTNYGTGHLDDKHAAIVAIQAQSVVPVEGGREYPVVPIVQDGTVSMLIVDPDTGAGLDRDQRGPHAGPGRPRSSATATGSTGVDRLREPQPGHVRPRTRTARPSGRRCSRRSTRSTGSYLRPISVTRATEARPGYVYDEAQDAMIDTATGEVYPGRRDRGQLRLADGERLDPGWRVAVGLETTRRCSPTRPCGPVPADHRRGRSSSPS